MQEPSSGNQIKDLSIQGALAVLILQQVFSFIKSFKNGKKSSLGEMDMEVAKVMVLRTVEEAAQPYKDSMDKLQSTAEEIRRGIERLVYITEERHHRRE